MLIDTLKKYILPSEINFINDMQRQSASILTIINYLNACFILKKENNCELISKEVKQAFEIRTINMNHLLNAFITLSFEVKSFDNFASLKIKVHQSIAVEFVHEQH